MKERSLCRVRKMACVIATGLLLQAGGCTLDLQTLVSGIADNLISSFVFGAFNLGGPF